MEGLQRWTWLMDCRNGVASCKRGDWRLLDKDFESKPIKRGGKNPTFDNSQHCSNLNKQCLLKLPTTTT